jgi:hypothetical protein
VLPKCQGGACCLESVNDVIMAVVAGLKES